MSAVEYLPGDRWLISGPTAAVHLAGGTAAALRWWPRIRDGVTAHELVEMLYDEGVLRSSAPFAMVVLESIVRDGEQHDGPVRAGVVRVIAAGDTVVMVETSAGERVSVSGAGLLTWAEHLVPDAAVVYVNCATLPGPGELLPMPAGVVRADAVRWAVGAEVTRSIDDGSAGDHGVAQAIDLDPALDSDSDTDSDSDSYPDLDVMMVGETIGDTPVDDLVGDDVTGDDATGDDVTGDDAVTLIGVVPVAGAQPDGLDEADASVPRYVLPSDDQQQEEAPQQISLRPSDEVETDLGNLEQTDLEQTVAADELPAEGLLPGSPGVDDDPAGQDAETADDPHPLEATISHDLDESHESHESEESDPDAVPAEAAASAQDEPEQHSPDSEPPGDVTQTVPPEDFGDGAVDHQGAGQESGVGDDDDDHDDDHDDERRLRGSEDDRSDHADHAAHADEARCDAGSTDDALSANPFPRMSLPPFVPPSAPGFITSATPGAPTHPPFAPPPYPAGTGADRPPVGDGPVGPSTIRDVPRPSGPPPFVPAATTLPPIATVPGASARSEPARSGATPSGGAADPDAVATGVPPRPPTSDAVAGGPGVQNGLSGDASHDGSAESRAGDHDGQTVLAESLPEDHRPPPLPPEPGPGQVYASLCPAGHANAPYAGDCRVCGTPIPATDPVLVDRPTMAVLRMSSGAVIELDRRVVVGRAPSVSRVASADVPHLVTVASPHGDVSRSHVEVRVDDWHIVVTDLNSTNGTDIHAPGRPVQLLRSGAGVVVEIGWQIDLGDGAGFLVDHL